jgi:O-antigen ligase
MGSQISVIDNIHQYNSSLSGQLIYYLYLGFIGLLLAFSDYMGLIPIPIFGINVYGADFILILLFLVFAFNGAASTLATSWELLLVMFVLFGISSMIYGYFEGHEIRAIIGDFRRLFLYTVSFGVVWKILSEPRRLVITNRIAYASVVPVIILSVLRAWRGISWTPSFEETDLRAVSYVSAPIVFWIFYSSAVDLALIKQRARSSVWLVIISFTLLISNYRLFWIIPLVGILGIILIAWNKRLLRSLRALKIFFLFSASLVAAILLLKFSQNHIYVLVERKFIENVLGFQFIDSFRYFVWGEAWARFIKTPIFGVGIGDRLQYDILSSAGTWYTRTGTTHNILLEILYQTGPLGLILFLLPHITFIIYILRGLSRITVQWSRPALAMLLTYLSLFSLGLFQPVLTVPSVTVLFYAIMAIAARYVYWGRRMRAEKES